jgi:hypothetical protein
LPCRKKETTRRLYWMQAHIPSGVRRRRSAGSSLASGGTVGRAMEICGRRGHRHVRRQWWDVVRARGWAAQHRGRGSSAAVGWRRTAAPPTPARRVPPTPARRGDSSSNGRQHPGCGQPEPTAPGRAPVTVSGWETVKMAFGNDGSLKTGKY